LFRVPGTRTKFAIIKYVSPELSPELKREFSPKTLKD